MSRKQQHKHQSKHRAAYCHFCHKPISVFAKAFGGEAGGVRGYYEHSRKHYCNWTCFERERLRAKFAEYLLAVVEYGANYDKLLALDPYSVEAKRLGLTRTERGILDIPSKHEWSRFLTQIDVCGSCIPSFKCDGCERSSARKIF